MWFREKALRRRAERKRLRELDGLAKAMDRSQAVLELQPNATVLRANTPFLGLTGYAPAEIIGCPHGMFLAPGEAEGPGYREFWRALHRGETVTKTTQLIGKDSSAVAVQAVYAPIIDMAGKVTRVALFVTDVSDLRIETPRPADASDAAAPVSTDEQDKVIATLSARFRALAAGDLDTRITTTFGERYDPVRDEFNAAVDRLGQAMAQITAAASGLGESSDEAARVSQTLSRGAGRQAADLQGARAGLRKMTSAAGRGVEGLRRVTEVAAGMRIEASGSRRAVRDAVGALTEIEQSAVRISQAIALVDEVAQQANLLSLITEVEGARAGEAGGSFQVVVDKMRGLAERASGAAREIKGVAAANSAYVARGARLVDVAGVSFGGMASRIAQIDGLVSSLARTAQDQALGLQAVGDAVNRVGDIAQTHAGSVDEAAAVTGKLVEEAEALMRATSPFRANVTSRPASRPEPAREGHHAPAANAVAHAHARIAAYARPA